MDPCRFHRSNNNKEKLKVRKKTQLMKCAGTFPWYFLWGKSRRPVNSWLKGFQETLRYYQRWEATKYKCIYFIWVVIFLTFTPYILTQLSVLSYSLHFQNRLVTLVWINYLYFASKQTVPRCVCQRASHTTGITSKCESGNKTYKA